MRVFVVKIIIQCIWQILYRKKFKIYMVAKKYSNSVVKGKVILLSKTLQRCSEFCRCLIIIFLKHKIFNIQSLTKQISQKTISHCFKIITNTLQITLQRCCKIHCNVAKSLYLSLNCSRKLKKNCTKNCFIWCFYFCRNSKILSTKHLKYNIILLELSALSAL